MDRSALRASFAPLALAAVAVLAGCGGFVADEGASGESTATLTPVPVPTTATPTGTTDAGTTPTPDGGSIRDPHAFSESHRSALWNRSYTVTRNVTIRAGDETLARVDRRAWADGRRLVLEQRSEHEGYPVQLAAGPRLSVWSTVDRGWFRLSGPNGTWYGRVRDVHPREQLADPSHHRRIEDLVWAFRLRVVDDFAVAGQLHYRFRSTDLQDVGPLGVPLRLTDVRNAQLSMVVDASGIVRSYRFSYRATFGDRPVTVVERFSLTRLDGTTARRPAWVRIAAAETGSQLDPPAAESPLEGGPGQRVPWPVPPEDGTVTDGDTNKTGTVVAPAGDRPPGPVAAPASARPGDSVRPVDDRDPVRPDDP